MKQHGHENQAQTHVREHERNRSATPTQSRSARTTAEWTTLGVSLVILLGIFGVISWLSFQGETQPATIAVESSLQDVRYEGDLYYLPVEVINRGDQTVEDVLVQAELDVGSGSPVSADFTVTFLAGGERAKGTFIFKDDPRQGTLTVHAVSYKEP
jgi:uncharacterized protein (TIGR02588 family)